MCDRQSLKKIQDIKVTNQSHIQPVPFSTFPYFPPMIKASISFTDLHALYNPQITLHIKFKSEAKLCNNSATVSLSSPGSCDRSRHLSLASAVCKLFCFLIFQSTFLILYSHHKLTHCLPSICESLHTMLIPQVTACESRWLLDWTESGIK